MRRLGKLHIGTKMFEFGDDTSWLYDGEFDAEGKACGRGKLKLVEEGKTTDIYYEGMFYDD